MDSYSGIDQSLAADEAELGEQDVFGRDDEDVPGGRVPRVDVPDEADPADALEQAEDVRGFDEDVPEERVPRVDVPDEADPADALEQAEDVPGFDEDSALGRDPVE